MTFYWTPGTKRLRLNLFNHLIWFPIVNFEALINLLETKKNFQEDSSFT